MKFTDAVTIEGTRLRDDGYLVVDASVARTGIQRYLGSEVGRPDLPYVDVLRPEEEVFDTASMTSFAHRPITDDHPKVAVTSANSKELAVGWTADEVARDGNRLRVPLMVSDQATIDKVQGGKRELSAGYSCELVWGDGVTEDGTPYQAKQTAIRANHVAIVNRGRAGKDVRIGDGATSWGTAPITDAHKEFNMSTRTVMVDGFSVEVTDQGAQAIEKLVKDRQDLTDKLAKAEAAHATAIDAKDKEAAKLQAELDDAKSKVLDAAAVSKMVADRVALEATAAKIAKDVKPSGLTDAQLKAAVVKTQDRFDAAKVDANAAYADACFDILAAEAGTTQDSFRSTLNGGGSHVQMSDAQRDRQQAFEDLLHFDQTGVERQAAN